MAFVFTLLEHWAPPTNHLSSQHALGSASSVHSRSNKLVSFLLTQFLSSPFLQRAPSVHVENTPKHFRKVFTCKIEGLDNTLKKGGNKKRCIWTKRNTALGSEWRGWGGRWLISFVFTISSGQAEASEAPEPWSISEEDWSCEELWLMPYNKYIHSNQFNSITLAVGNSPSNLLTGNSDTKIYKSNYKYTWLRCLIVAFIYICNVVCQTGVTSWCVFELPCFNRNSKIVHQ